MSEDQDADTTATIECVEVVFGLVIVVDHLWFWSRCTLVSSLRGPACELTKCIESDCIHSVQGKTTDLLLVTDQDDALADHVKVALDLLVRPLHLARLLVDAEEAIDGVNDVAASKLWFPINFDVVVRVLLSYSHLSERRAVLRCPPWVGFRGKR